MRIETTEPGLQVGDGSQMPTEGLPGLDVRSYSPFAGIALETQAWPDAQTGRRLRARSCGLARRICTASAAFFQGSRDVPGGRHANRSPDGAIASGRRLVATAASPRTRLRPSGCAAARHSRARSSTAKVRLGSRSEIETGSTGRRHIGRLGSRPFRTVHSTWLSGETKKPARDACGHSSEPGAHHDYQAAAGDFNTSSIPRDARSFWRVRPNSRI